MKPPPGHARSVDAAEYRLDGFVLRTPLLATADFLGLSEGLSHRDWTSEEAFAAACARIRQRMRRLVSLPAVAEALFVASPSLADSLQAWIDAPDTRRGRRVERSLIRYLSRMAGRPTPFGLFSGCSVGRVGAHTRLALEGRDRYRRRSRLDMDYLCALTDALNRDAELRRRLVFRPNDTLVRVGSRWHYIEPRIAPDRTCAHHCVALETTPYLELALRSSGAGAGIAEIADALVRDDPDIAAAEALAYVEALIDAQVLISTLQPAVTGSDPAAELARRLHELGAPEVASGLDDAVKALAALDASGLGRPRSAYVSIRDRLAALPARVEAAGLVHVDLVKPAELELGPAVQAEIERCAALVSRFAPAADALAGFRRAFEQRYGIATLPLLQVLDPETGIGLGETAASDPSPLLAGLPLTRAGPDDGLTWRPQHAWLLERLHEAWRQGLGELALEDGDLESLFGPPPAQAPAGAFGLGVTLVASSAAAVERGEFLLVLGGAEGPSGVRVLGRFAHADAQIDALVRRHLAQEEAREPEALFAEIVHLPPGRAGNIVVRPVLRRHELLCMGRSGAPPEQQLALADLRVTVRGGGIVLLAAGSDARVVPRLTCAHHFTHPSMPTPYRFLAMLQAAELRAAFRWDWGPLASAPFLPRLRWGRIVLARAQWRLTHAQAPALARSRGRERFLALRAWAEARQLPRTVELVQSDQRLLVDLDNPVSVEAIVDAVAARAGATLVEMLPGPDELCVTGGEGAFTHEMWVPVVRRAGVSPTDQQGERRASPAIRRAHAPGGEWLYAQIYAGGSEVDRLLVSVVGPLVVETVAAGLAQRWFFVRFDQPTHHLRLRLRGDARALHGDVLPRLQTSLAPWIEAGGVSRLALDTYQPEIERYGGPVGLDLSERIFQADSEAVLALLGLVGGDAGAEARWRLTLRGLDSLIDDLGFDAPGKRALVARRRLECGLEFGAESPDLRHRLADRFRRQRATLATLLDPKRDAASPLAPGLEIWRARSQRLAPLTAGLRDADSRGVLRTALSAVADSHLHMHVNRMARADGRAHELVLFDLLDRHYASVDARARAEGRAAPGPGSPAPAPRERPGRPRPK